MALEKIIDGIFAIVQRFLDAIAPTTTPKKLSLSASSRIPSRKAKAAQKSRRSLIEAAQLPAAQSFESIDALIAVGASFLPFQAALVAELLACSELARQQAILLESQYQKAFPIGVHLFRSR